MGAIWIDALHQPRTLIVDIRFLAAIGVVRRDATVVVPDATRVHFAKNWPNAGHIWPPCQRVPTPRRDRPTGQPAFGNDVLLVVPINLAFTNGIGRRSVRPASS